MKHSTLAEHCVSECCVDMITEELVIINVRLNDFIVCYIGSAVCLNLLYDSKTHSDTAVVLLWRVLIISVVYRMGGKRRIVQIHKFILVFIRNQRVQSPPPPEFLSKLHWNNESAYVFGPCQSYEYICPFTKKKLPNVSIKCTDKIKLFISFNSCISVTSYLCEAA
jgi:hypothetical protein